MANKLKGILSGAGFYAVLGICLVTAAVAGWFLLLDDSGGTGEVETPPVEAAAPAEVPVELSEAPAEPEVPETPPEPAAQVPAAAMPEVRVPEPEVPVVAEAPQLVVSPLSGKVVTAFPWITWCTARPWGTGGPMTASTSPPRRAPRSWPPAPAQSWPWRMTPSWAPP